MVPTSHAGAMVVELLPYNWEWKGVSKIYKNITQSMGDIHHFAWRAKHPKWAVYPSDHEARYAEWTAEECASRSAPVFGLFQCISKGLEGP